MDNFVGFISDNYVWFLVITIFLIFALIGYFYDTKHADVQISKKEMSDELAQDIPIQSEKSINDMIGNTSTVDTTNAGVNLQTDETNINE